MKKRPCDAGPFLLDTLRPMAATTHDNSDPQELAKFSELAHRWWDPNSEFKALHDINPLRLNWIDQRVPLNGTRVLDVGCGGGLLAEAMAERGADVVGIDLGDKALAVARLHLLESGRQVDYRKIAVEALATQQPAAFDVVTCMEMLEHVPDPAAIVGACAALVKPGGTVFFSTISRNLRAYLQAVIAAEYLLNLLPRGTHDYAKLIRPAELAHYCRDGGLQVVEIIGMGYHPIRKTYALNDDPRVNYLMRTIRQ
jgi:2-polyprenyl-6-hydroxyphenyl methylase / 3-demethylubiquinone-9 3-methyltransferase